MSKQPLTDLERALTARRALENDMREINKDSSFEERSPFSVCESHHEGQQITITTTGYDYQEDRYDLYIDGERVESLQDALRVMNTLIRFHERTKSSRKR